MSARILHRLDRTKLLFWMAVAAVLGAVIFLTLLYTPSNVLADSGMCKGHFNGTLDLHGETVGEIFEKIFKLIRNIIQVAIIVFCRLIKIFGFSCGS